MSAPTRTVIDVIVEDHREVEELFKQLESTSDSEQLRQLADQVIAELVRHSVAEEQYLYPAFREHLDDGDELADHEISEHSEIEETLKELESLDVTEERFQTLVRELISEVRHHVEDEENDALPRLENACGRDELIELGQKVEQAKQSAPTRPHPSAPDTPPWNKILAPGAGFVDRVRDSLAGRQTG
ncbi:hemerythrin domain-containing protein [Phytoactinopolyspora halotolerans]|uniref:Hemerythrin domain-containing protein n=2 Tax=Phytoactinopolyspora halotolerans TaxID=1981512 RepID=A0A6L9SBS0_9ACTN|nr:hemerythrin domain-containing protein [Phytoactinopolyspora halotolerans]NEE01460.1 hemerythrin domain-containing protein [Phytoactinopolyspora halotolerans]